MPELDIGDVGRRHPCPAHDPGAMIDRGVPFVAELCTAVWTLQPRGVGIGRRAAAALLPRRLGRRRLHHRRVDQRAGLDRHSLGVELAPHLSEPGFDQAPLRQQTAEAADGRMVR